MWSGPREDAVTPRRSAVLAAAVALVAVVSGVVATQFGTSSATKINRSVPGRASLIPAADAPRAPELRGISAFLNTPPLTMRSLRGRVVLVDFWTYSCINCRRTFPFLRALQRTYAGRGLTILGVHSPEFGFEKDPHNVAAAVKSLDVTWPVAEDPAMATWSAYRNEYWPADYLVDREGRIRFTQFGEGNDAAVETAIRALLDDGGNAGPKTVGAVPTTQRPPTAGEGVTPESYFGAQRGAAYLAGHRVIRSGTVTRSDSGDQRDVLYLDGRFAGAPEYVESAAPHAVVRLHFRAKDVYLLAAPARAGSSRMIEVRLNGASVPLGQRGVDVQVDSHGDTVARVRSDELLHVLTAPHVRTGRLELIADPGIRFFTFTFGG
jgi:thiol-disulfide isomerase/thioredoxin